MKKYVGVFILAFLSLFVVNSFAGNPPSGTNGQVFNGRDQYVKITSHADLNIAANESFTVSCWVKVSAFNMGKRILSKRNFEYQFIDPINNATYELWIGDGGSPNHYFANNVVSTTVVNGGSTNNMMSDWIGKPASTGTWYHLCMVIDRTADGGKGDINLYQDGAMSDKHKISGRDFTGWKVDNAYDVLLGCTHDGLTKFSQFFNGEIANVRFWKKALTAAEVAADMTAATPATTGLVAAYDFKNITGTTVPDISGKGHNGTLVGYPVEQAGGTISAAPVTQNTSFTGRSNTDDVILGTAITVSGQTGVNLTNLKLRMTGTTAVSDVKNIKIYSTGRTNKFDSRFPENATLLGTIATPATGELTCDLAGKKLAGGVNYLWITYDVADAAVEGNQLDAELVSITTAEETYNWYANGGVSGARTILLAHKLLYDHGDPGFFTPRIPGIITAANGDLVIVTDKRKGRGNDLPSNIDVVIKRSKDGGKTWLADQTIAQGTSDAHGYGDAALARTNEPNGIICIFVGDNGLGASTPYDLIRTYICKSADNGVTWTAPIDITNQLYGDGCTDPIRKRWCGSFCGSGSGLLTSNGRIMFVAAVKETSVFALTNHVFYSDDNGVTWNVSGPAKTKGDEAKVVELNDGTILMSIRQKGKRWFNKSTDNGETWGEAYPQNDLITPACNGDIIRYTSTKKGFEKDRLLHSLPNDANIRQNVSVFISYDEGATWPIKKTICPTGADYSSLCILNDGTIGAYVEEQPANGLYSLYYSNFSLKWLSNGTDDYYASGAIQAVVAPIFTQPTGIYDTAQNISLSTTTTGAEIRYTIDGSIPTATSILYGGSVLITETTMIRAIAVKAGMANSAVVSATYTIKSNSGYCQWEGKRAIGSKEHRVIRSIEVKGATLGGDSQFFVVTNPNQNSQSEVYVSKMGDVLNATPGDELTFFLTKYDLSWMHFYVYIDYNQNGRFDADELVSYSYYQGKDSKGVDRRNNVDHKNDGDYCPDVLPSFTIPADAKTGNTRVRFNVDWNSIDPCGDAEMAKNQGTMLDFTINIASAKKYPVTFTQPSVGGTFTVKNGAMAITSGESVLLGTALTVDATPAPGYKIKTIKVNGAISGTTFRVTATNVVSVEFEEAYTFDYTFDATKGRVAVVDAGATAVASGDLLAKGSVVTVTVTPADQHKIKSITLNGKLHTATSPFTLTINEATTLAVVFESEKYILTYNTPQYGQMLVTLAGGTTPLNSGDEIPYGGLLHLAFSSTQGTSLAKLLINGEDWLMDVMANALDVDIFSNIVIEAEFTASSGIHNSSSDNLITYVNKEGYLVVEGAEIGSLIEVYDIAGAEIAKAVVQSNSEVLSSVQLSTASYLVKISNKSESIVRRVIK
ncbi:MAG: LamG-like jellyroll fold domain-containing protein [Bacteroidaceae bacterium]